MAAQLRLLERPEGAGGALTTEADVHFFCTGRDRWAAYDRRIDPRAPQAFLGRLQRIAGLFEVSFADPERQRAYCVSLNESRSHFIGTADPYLRPTLRIV